MQYIRILIYCFAHK